MSAEGSSLRELLFGTATSEERHPHTSGPDLSPSSRLPEGLPAHLGMLVHRLFQQTQPFYVTDECGQLVACSKAFADLQYDASSGAMSLSQLIDEVRQANSEVRRSEAIMIDKKERRFLSRHFPVFGDQGQLAGFGGVYEDVSQLAKTAARASESEDWLQDVIRSSSDWVWAMDRHSNLTFVSPSISEAVEEPAQNLIGQHLFSMGEFNQENRLSARTRDDIARRSPFRARHFLLRTRRGIRHILLSGVPVFEDDSGAYRGYRGTGVDISEQVKSGGRSDAAKACTEDAYAEIRRQNDELRIALAHAETTATGKVDFLAMMGHELRTPLNSIIGFSDAAIQRVHGPLVGPYAEYFDNIHKAGRHLLEIINDLLEMASLERREPTIDLRAEPVQPLIQEAIGLVDRSIHTRDLGSDAILPKTALIARCDHLRARQILVNLIGNALKFTPERGRIGIDVEERANGMIAITVWDTGIGISAEELPRIFEKFYRVEQPGLPHGVTGSGLGLSISRHLARLMGGDLTATSIPGKGSRFTLTLPQATASRNA